MKNKKYDFTEYMNSSKTLFKMLFGDELYNKLESTPLKSIDWDGIDIDYCGITAIFPNVKQRFSKKWIKYFTEHNGSLLDLYLQTIFHYGYQQYHDEHSHEWDDIKNTIKILKEQKQNNGFILVSEEEPPQDIELLVKSPSGTIHLSNWRPSYSIFSCQDKSESCSGWSWKLI